MFLKLNHKKIFIAPYTPTSNAFKEYLLKHTDIKFCGFIDKTKSGDDIFKIENLQNKDFDYILIISPNHQEVIYNEYIKLIDKSKIFLVNINQNKYTLSKTLEVEYINNIENYSKQIDNNHQKRDGIVFVSKGFISANNKFLYLYCIKNNIKATIVTENVKQLKELQNHNLPAYNLYTKEADKTIASSKYIIFDQANYVNFYISKEQITIQLWHGVGLKKMSKLTNIVYDYFISTSTWTNDTNFKNIFLAKKYLNCGYSRNDFLLRQTDDLDLVFCNQDIYNTAKKNNIILYMPTIREYCDDKIGTLPLEFLSLNQYLQTINMTMIIKLHPITLEFSGDDIKQNYSNIIFHDAFGDIYPILKYTDILITDYSSVAYDFLLLDRPIIFFDYDRDIYEQNMGGFLFDYDEYSPGIKVKTQEELCEALVMEDKYKQERQKIKNLFFDDTYKDSCKNIMDIISL